MAENVIPTGEPAKVYTGIRDVPIYAGESSSGNQLPGGPYRSAEIIAITVIMGPTISWVRTHAHAPGTWKVLVVGVVLAAAVTVALRLLLPKRRPSLGTRAVFAWCVLVPPHVRGGKAANRTPPPHARRTARAGTTRL